MRTIELTTIALSILLLGGLARPDPARPLNPTCPISGNAVDGSIAADYDGRTIAFCCGGCMASFDEWTDERRKGYFATLAGPPSRPETAPDREDARAADYSKLYPLDTCPVSGERVGSRGKPVVRTHDGREVRFCCGDCAATFESKPETYTKKLQERLIVTQRPFYPMTTCMLTGEPLEEDGQAIGVDHLHGNRLVRLCCTRCLSAFKRNPARQLARLDAAVRKVQGPQYPLQVCVVSGRPLPEDGGGAEIVIANRLVRLCCEGCLGSITNDPAAHLARIDAAWRASGKIRPAAPVTPASRPSN